MPGPTSQSNVKHKGKRTGSSANHKKLRDQAKKSITSLNTSGKKQVNLKAHTFSSIYAAQRDRVRKASTEHKRHHSHMDRKDLVDVPPPRTICVAGPPGSGKSTLIKCLVKHFTRAPAFECIGPVTVRVNNTLRFTFIEVNNDIGAMIDTAKIADVVLLVIDGSYGFELETFEYLNMLKTHGFPKVMGVLTHMDHLSPGTFSRTKKIMKKRFQEEVTDGAKLLHVSGLIHGRYPRREILNIGRYLSIAKPKPQTFRNEHPYLVIDRVEDMTHPGLIHNNPTIDRTVALYGYVRGCPVRQGANVHLLGVGDFQCKDIAPLDDPVPLMSQHTGESTEDREKRRTLKKQDIKIHAPFSNVGTVINDKDAVYIKARSDKIRWSNKEDLTMLGSSGKSSTEDLEKQREDVFRRLGKLDDHQRFVQTLMDNNGLSVGPKLDEMLKDQSISLFGDDNGITSQQFEELRKYRQGGSALPNEALNNQEDIEEEEEELDDNAVGQHDVDDMSELLGTSSNNTQKDDFYSRMTIKEVVGPDGRVRKQVVFQNQIDISKLRDDDDDGDADGYERGEYDDSDDGYYSLDEEDVDEEYTSKNTQKFYQENKKRSLGSMDNDDDDYDDDDYDFSDENEDDLDGALANLNFGGGEGENDDGYNFNDYPDYDEDLEANSGSDEDDVDDYQLKKNNKNNKSEEVYLGSSKHTIHPPSYDVTNFVRGGLSGLYQSLNDPAQTREKNLFFTRSAQSFQRTNLSLNDLVYGAKESIFDQQNQNSPGASFGGVFDDNQGDDQTKLGVDNDDNDDDGDGDDFFVSKHRVRQTLFNGNDDENGGFKTAGRANTSQNTFAKSHLDFSHQKGENIDKKSAQANIQKISNNQSVNLFDGNLDIDSTFNLTKEKVLSNWGDGNTRDTLRNRFVTGDWDAAKAKFDGKEETETLDENGEEVYPEEFNTDDEDLDHDEKVLRRRNRREWQRKRLFGLDQKDSNANWADDGFGQKKKKGQNKYNGLDDKVFDHQEQLFGDFEEVDNGRDADGGQDDDDAKKIRKLLEQKIKRKDKFLAELEREAAQDEAESAKGNKDNRGEKKKSMAKQIAKDHFDYFQAQHDIILQRIEKSKEEMAKLSPEDRLALFGAQPGQYVRIILTSVPCEFVEHLDPTYPIVLGGLLPTEQNMGYLNMRVKKHRWFHRLLKSQDPLIWSSGWRRFQSIPLFHVEDIKGNNRFLKYTPEHLHCLATTYGPLVAPNSGVIAFKNVYMATKSVDMTNKTTSSFRVALTGVVLNNEKNVEVRKKLKLIGTPFEIFNKTAYIQGMFNSALEVARFEGAKIQTVSGIPGRIVKAVTHEGKEGTFRATFNDKIVKSDIIMCKTFVVVKTYKYYNPVTSLLLANKAGWKGMRTQKEIRADKGVVIKTTQENEYKDIIREKRKFNKLHIPANLAQALPFSSKQKLSREQAKSLNLKIEEKKLRRKVGDDEKVSKIMSKRKVNEYEAQRRRFEDKKDTTMDAFVSALGTLQKDKDEKEKAHKLEKRKRAIGNTTENRERIERMKQKAKKARHIEKSKAETKKQRSAGGK
jgi:hypothetical protein